MDKIQEKNTPDDKISVAPMLDWTDKHFRYFMRLICKHAVLYTEMVACPALILGDRHKLLDFNASESPVVLQVGGYDPRLMKECAKMAADYGYSGININAGCPSGRVQSGRFGACLMRTPEVVADCVAAMRAAGSLPVSVKTRIALSDDPRHGFEALLSFADMVAKAGCQHLIIHARRAKLNLSPRDNRQKLPLDYDTVYRLKQSFPDMFITINGNILSWEQADVHLQRVDGVMIGRWAYGNPYALATADERYYGDTHAIPGRRDVLERMIPYLERNADKLAVIGPHLAGLFHGCPNAKAWRQVATGRDLDAIRAFCAALG